VTKLHQVWGGYYAASAVKDFHYFALFLNQSVSESTALFDSVNIWEGLGEMSERKSHVYSVAKPMVYG